MRKLFVIMPFGRKRSSPKGEVMDFDRVYATLIRAAAEAADFEPLRSDEIAEPGRITDQFLRELFHADTVLADVTLPNENVFYELGVRQTMGTGPTILIAREGAKLPFNFQDQRVLPYEIGSQGGLEASRSRLAEWLARSVQEPGTNPIQQFLRSVGATTSPGMDNDAFEQDLSGRIQRARNANQLIAVWKWSQQFSRLPPLTLASLASSLADKSEWRVAADVIERALEARPNDFELHRYHGFYLRKLGPDYYEPAKQALLRALALNPGDPEALGMLGGLCKRQGQFAEAAKYYEQADVISPKNAYIRSNRAALALLLNPTEPSMARELYRELLALLDAIPINDRDEWTELMFGDAHFVLEEDAQAEAHYSAACEDVADPNVLGTAAAQLELFATHGFRPEKAKAFARRLRKSGDGAVRVTLERAAPVGGPEPSPASGRKPPLLIHLSDVHFGTRPGSDGKPVNMHRFFDGDYSQTLAQHLTNEFGSSKRRFSLDGRSVFLIVSGDFGYTATSAEFKLALAFLEDIAGTLNVPRERIIVCPGNHDVNWAESKIDRSRRFDPYLSFLKKFYGSSFAEFYPLIKWDFQFDSQRPDPSDLVSVRHYPDDGVLILSLNSCVYETEEHHYGFVGGRQLRNASRLLDPYPSTGMVRIAVFHHHLHPYPEPVELGAGGEHWHDQSAVRDSALLEKHLEKNGFDLVLHGHKHKPQIRESLVRDPGFADTARPLVVCGAGSCGVNSRELEHSVANQYQVIEVLNVPRVPGADFLRLEWREIAVTPEAEWITPRTWSLRG